MGLIAGIIFGLLSLMAPPGIAVAIFLISWMMSRWSLVFPGIAIDKEISFELSWELTKDHQLLMFLVVIVFPVLLNIPTFFLEKLPKTIVLTIFLSTLSIVFTVAALSVSYQLIDKENYTNSKEQ
jgi:hypothetical protein